MQDKGKKEHSSFHGTNFVMERKWCKKIKQLIKDGRPAKLKSYIKKHDIDVQHFQFTNGGTILHYCCKYHEFNGFRYFTEKGICLSTKDDDGNTALHIALKEALKRRQRSEVSEIYNQIILPILERHPESLKWRNHHDITCRDLLDQLREKQDEQCRESPEESWNDKLADEVEHEYQEDWGSRFTGDLSEEENFQESYSDWSERMHCEFHKKRKYSTSLPSSSKKPKSQEQDFNSKLRQEREKMRKKYEENQKKAQQNYKRHQKDVYERKWQELSEKIVEKQLHFSDIPWPFKKSVSELEDFLFHDLTESEARKKYLRDQVKRWHPDKFLQKFGNHILSTDKECVLQRVKQVSQELNHLFEKFK
ncbi:NF-kappa-B inhibitor-like protein 1 [Saccostrea echinata]|uniref:NF-kappa-B inhibitor-like protein 1 n=1 Tax=Saccostrea echinata TaxID=191078 RepID=UPI002A80F5A7|nr:NF-kappa-B inhibitor-like protein 1 [Saccostrea echinata]